MSRSAQHEDLSWENVLVACGNAALTSTGFGHGPAPRARLRHRLEAVRGFRVTLIREYNTGKCCSTCGEEMVFVGERTMGEHAATLAKKGMDVNMGVAKRPIHGVLKCLKCNASGAECETGPRILESAAMSTPPSTSARYSHVWLSTTRDPGTSSSPTAGTSNHEDAVFTGVFPNLPYAMHTPRSETCSPV